MEILYLSFCAVVVSSGSFAGFVQAVIQLGKKVGLGARMQFEQSPSLSFSERIFPFSSQYASLELPVDQRELRNPSLAGLKQRSCSRRGVYHAGKETRACSTRYCTAAAHVRIQQPCRLRVVGGAGVANRRRHNKILAS